MRFPTLDVQEHHQIQQDTAYIENWLHHASFSAVSPCRPPSFHASPLPAREFAASGRGVIQQQYIHQSPSIKPESPKDSISDFFCSGMNIKPVSCYSLSTALGVFEVVTDIQAPPGATYSQQIVEGYAQEVDRGEGLLYDPLYDGTTEDERILRRNVRDPWPYDQRRLVPTHLQSTSMRPSVSAPYPTTRLSSLFRPKRTRARKAPSQDHQPAVFSRATTSRTASSFGFNLNCRIGSMSSRLSSMKAVSKNKRNAGARGGRIPNSMVPHPDWGTFAFRSDSDSLCSDDSDGDVRTWLERVVRRNTRIGLESFKIATGPNRPMTIEEYEKRGSWLNGHGQEYREWVAMGQEHGKQREQTINESSPSSCCPSSRSSSSGIVHNAEIRAGSLCDERNSSLGYNYEAGSSFGVNSFYAPGFGSNSFAIHSSIASHLSAIPTLCSTQPQPSVNNAPAPIHGSLSTHGDLPMSTPISSAGRTLRKAARKAFRPFIRRAAATTTSFSMVSISGIRLFPAPRANTMAGAENDRRRDEPSNPSPSEHALEGHRLPGAQSLSRTKNASLSPVPGGFPPTPNVARRVCGCQRSDAVRPFDSDHCDTVVQGASTDRVATIRRPRAGLAQASFDRIWSLSP